MSDSLFSNEILTLKQWQSYFIKSVPSYGNIIASILQAIYKNKNSSLINLLNKIEKNSQIVLTGEGAIELLPKFMHVLNFTPLFFISRSENSVENFTQINEKLLCIRCDFAITLNFHHIKNIPDNYIFEVNEYLKKIDNDNKKILIKFLLKQMSYGNYFIPRAFIEKEIFNSKIFNTSYTVNDIYNNLKIDKFSNFGTILLNNNYDNENNIISNIKILNIPFTTIHADNYLSKAHQQIYSKNYHLGKNELNIKLLYLNSDYFVTDEGKNVYDLLIENIYYNFFPKNENENHSASADFFSFENLHYQDTDSFLEEMMEIEGIDDEYNDADLSQVKNNLSSFERKKIILEILKRDKTPRHELDFLNSLDLEKLKVKKIFVRVLDYLLNPFLSKVVNTTAIKFLKQYIFTNYGESLKEDISDEKRALIEKKLIDFVEKKDCFFLEFFNNISRLISESTGEKQFIVDTVIKSSNIYKNFFFKKFLSGPSNIQTKIFSNFIKIIDNKFFTFQNDGSEDNLIVVPYLKIKEFLVYLISSQIDDTWEVLSTFFNDLLKIIKSNKYTGIISDKKIEMIAFNANLFNIIVKDKKNISDFQIKSIDDIEFIFNEENQEKLKNTVNCLFQLHSKEGFGFDNKKDFLRHIELYNKRCEEYYFYKHKMDKFEKNLINGFFSFIYNFFMWIPKSINQMRLSKIKNHNNEIVKKTSYHYIDKKNKKKGLFSFNKDITDMKNKIYNMIKNDDKNSNNNSPNLQKNSSKNQKQNNQKATDQKLRSIIEPEILNNDDEINLFNFLKEYLYSDKDVIFSHNIETEEEKVVIYIKDIKFAKSKFLYKEDKNLKKDINTIDEYSTRYYHIQNLIRKHYLVKKEMNSINNYKKIFALFLSQSYLHHQPKT